MLLAIKELVRKNPKLKYAPRISDKTFSALLKTDQKKAYEYGKKVIITPTYREPAYGFIISSIAYASQHMNVSPEIYRLGAEAYQAKIDNSTPILRGLLNISGLYQKMAAWYRMAHDTSSAIEAEQKAILSGKKTGSR